jgi:hypothetical protein
MIRVALVTAAICIVLMPARATTAAAAPARPNRISVSYVAPKNPAHQPIYRKLREARFLEKLKQFLSPFRLPRTLRVKTRGCDGDANAWYEDDVITVCYEYIDQIWKNVPAENTPQGMTPIDALVGPVFDTCLHEFGHALFDILNLPVFGREEDAADQVAAYITLHLGRDTARRLIGGTAHAYMTEAKAAAPPKLEQYANEHGTPAQRFYNLLCIAYGADPKFSEFLVAKGYLPKERADGCEDEYEQVAFAYQTLIGPHVDQRLAKKVLDKSWLPPPTTKLRRRLDAIPSAQAN